jgi:hypothetical protein
VSTRWSNVIVLVLFLVAVPPRVFVWLVSPEVGKGPQTALLVAGAVALVPVLLLPLAWRRKA